MPFRRRDFILLWAQAGWAAHQHGSSGSATPDYKRQFLSDKETIVLRRAAALIVPADERSGGAAAARVEDYIDFVLQHGTTELQEAWRVGLARLDKAGDLTQQLTKDARNEFRPRAINEHFFVLLKSAVVEAFYTSQEGIEKELGYLGMGFVMEFPDFTKIETRTPPGHRPLLREQT